jgi:hypothetical protein
MDARIPATVDTSLDRDALTPIVFPHICNSSVNQCGLVACVGLHNQCSMHSRSHLDSDIVCGKREHFQKQTQAILKFKASFLEGQSR